MTVRCRDCRHFQPDANNPAAAMGRCLHNARHGYFFARELHRCDDFSDTPDADRKTTEPAKGG